MSALALVVIGCDGARGTTGQFVSQVQVLLVEVLFHPVLNELQVFWIGYGVKVFWIGYAVKCVSVGEFEADLFREVGVC
uniref:Uncharacterized protein n=1 Tax=Cannabis sativa TaxID=3483 RepID=A0A803PL28_CANSA